MTITAQGADRLRALMAFVAELPEEEFDFSGWQRKDEECGTIACAGGWCPTVFPEFGEPPGGALEPWFRMRLSEWFDLNDYDVGVLFLGYESETSAAIDHDDMVDVTPRAMGSPYTSYPGPDGGHMSNPSKTIDVTDAEKKYAIEEYGTRFRILWKSKITGALGKGEILFKRADAEDIIAAMNKEYPEIDHYLGLVSIPLPDDIRDRYFGQ